MRFGCERGQSFGEEVSAEVTVKYFLYKLRFLFLKKWNKIKGNSGWACRYGASCLRWHCLRSRSEGGGCHGSRSAWSLSGCHATTHTDLSLSLSVSLSHAHTHTHTHIRTHTHTQAVGNTLYCRIINRRYQKAAPLSSSSMPMGPYHSHLPFHPSILSTHPLSSLEPTDAAFFL